MQQVDGGGSLLPHPVSQLRKNMQISPIGFEFKCKSYIMGLAYYGSVIPVKMAFQKKTEIQLNTIVIVCCNVEKNIRLDQDFVSNI